MMINVFFLMKWLLNMGIPSGLLLKFVLFFVYREHGQNTTSELRNKDFRKDLEEREKEREKEKGSNRRMIEPERSSVALTKRQKVDQVPAASLDADDPLDENDSDSDSDDDDTAALMAELQRIQRERAAEQEKKVSKSIILFNKLNNKSLN